MPTNAPAPQPAAPGDGGPLAPLVAAARADLAARLGVGPERIELVEARAVVWPDTGLGCPEPGMGYMQVLTEGAYISLREAGAIYSYHSGRGRGPFYCPQSAGPPAPSDQGGGDT